MLNGKAVSSLLCSNVLNLCTTALLFSSFVVDSQQGIEEDDDDQEMVIEVPEQPSGLTRDWFFQPVT